MSVRILFLFSSLRLSLVLVLLHRRSTVIWAIRSVPLSQHYSVQLHRLLTASAAFDDLIFVSMDWRPEKRLNCRRSVSAYIFLLFFLLPPFSLRVCLVVSSHRIIVIDADFLLLTNISQSRKEPKAAFLVFSRIHSRSCCCRSKTWKEHLEFRIQSVTRSSF